MTISTKYKTDKTLYSVWNQTQVGFFKTLMESINVDFFKAGKVFSNLADSLDAIPTFTQFQEEYEKNN